MLWLKHNCWKVAIFLLSFFLPNVIRKRLYGRVFGYQFSQGASFSRLSLITCERLAMGEHSKIGRFNLVDCDVLVLDPGSEIRSWNVLINIGYTRLYRKATIVTGNRFVGAKRSKNGNRAKSRLEVGINSAITFKHYFDLFESVTLGNEVVVGGIGSQFWTHGFDNRRERISGPIGIGNNCYLGSRVLVNANLNICDDVTVGGGSVVHKSIKSSGLYVSNTLIKK